MSDSGRLSIGLLAVLAVVASGCGSTTETSTSTSTTVNTAAGTSAPTGASAQTATQSTTQTATQSTSSTVAQKPANATGQEKAAEVKRTGQAQGSKPSAPAPKPSTEPAEQHVPLTRQFKRVERREFMASCTAEKGSTSSCECLIVKYELKNVEKLHGLAELTLVEYSLLRSLPLPLLFQRVVEECKGPRT